jgi:aryl-alcohol dehydrogenase-like predicted oxidoreductase
MQKRPLGQTGLEVSLLGLGAGHLGSPELAERDVERLLHGALDLGVTLFDAARSYGLAEERLGRHLGAHRHRIVLSTKCGYGIPGHEDWTPGCITEGVEAALRALRTDHLDVLHLHSCPRQTLERPGVLEALEAAVRAGKVRVAAYAGEDPALSFAIRSGVFGSVQTSVSFLDQRGLQDAVAEASAHGLGVVAKRPLANAPWRFDTRPAAPDLQVYWDRFRQLALSAPEAGWEEVALRFAAFSPGVSSAIAGTSRLSHLEQNVRHLEAGPLPSAERAALERAFAEHGAQWHGVV